MTIMDAENLDDELRLHINQYKAKALSILAEAEGYVHVGSMLEQHRRR